MDFNFILEELSKQIPEIPSSKKYWLIRTQSGTLYETFIDNSFVGLDHKEIPLINLKSLNRNFSENNAHFQDAIKLSVQKYYLSDDSDDLDISPQRIGLISGQIYRFYNQVKEGDVVIIPSTNSELVSFGIVTESEIATFTEEESRKFDTTSQFLNKRVKWIADFNRRKLDPNIFRMFTAHHAISDVSKYADIIERSLHDFFVLDHEAHLIINVEQKDALGAKDLFGLGYNFLELFDDIASELKIEGVSSDHLKVEINLNSPGKIDLKSAVKKTTLVAGLILFVCGGGYKSSNGATLSTDGIKSLLNAISEYRDRNSQRDMKVVIFNKYKDSLKVSSPEDIVKILKQFDENKDKPK